MNNVKQKLRRIKELLFSNIKFKIRYLKYSKKVSTLGFKPIFSENERKMKKRWREQKLDIDGKDIPEETYLTVDDSIEKMFLDVLPYIKRESPIIEIGCNMGRILNYLYTQGYTELTGIEIGHNAKELMDKNFDDLSQYINLIIGDVIDKIRLFKDSQFELVYCHSVLVNIHPKYNRILFDNMARISNRFVLILENEGSYNAYPKDFQKLIERRGYKMIISKIYRTGCKELAIPYRINDLFYNNTIRLFVKDLTKIE